jgi:hypothetical protein
VLSKDFVHPFGGMSTQARYPVGVVLKDKLYAGVPGGVLNVLGVYLLVLAIGARA